MSQRLLCNCYSFDNQSFKLAEIIDKSFIGSSLFNVKTYKLYFHVDEISFALGLLVLPDWYELKDTVMRIFHNFPAQTEEIMNRYCST